MITGAELFLLGYGLYACIKSRFDVGKNKYVEGARARLLGAICLLPLPLSFGFGFVFALFSSRSVEEISASKIPLMVELSIVLVTLAVVLVLRDIFYKSLVENEVKK